MSLAFDVGNILRNNGVAMLLELLRMSSLVRDTKKWKRVSRFKALVLVCVVKEI